MTDAQMDDFLRLKVSDLMTREVVSVPKTATILEAVRLMVQKGFRHLPVVSAGKVVAVLSDRDVRLMVTDLVDAQERRRYLESTTVMRHASSPVTTGTADLPVREAARIFVEARIGCLPIVDENQRLIGIVTQTDLLKWLTQASV